MVERFAKERARETRGGQFRLGGEDDEDEDSVLTHGGKALRWDELLLVSSWLTLDHRWQMATDPKKDLEIHHSDHR